MATTAKDKPSRSQLALRVGDFVEVTKDDGSKTTGVVVRDPWKLGGHTWTVGVSGIPGGFLLSRVRKVAMKPA